MTVLAWAIAQVPFRIYHGEDLVDDPAHPLVKRFASPNPLMSQAKFFATVATHVLTSGQSLTTLEGGTSSTRVPDRMIPRVPGTVKPDRPTSDLYDLRGWKVDGYRDNFPTSQVVRVEYAQDPVDPLGAISPIGVARLEFETDHLAQRWNRGALLKGGAPRGILKYIGAGRIDEEELDDAEVRFNRRYAGPDDAEGVAVLGQNFEYQHLGFSAKDLQFLQGRQFVAEAIARLYGVPPLLLGIFDSASLTRASAYLQKRLLYENAAIPIGTQIEQSFNAAVIWPYDSRLTGLFDWSAVDALSDLLLDKLEAASGLAALHYTPDEINEALGLGMPDDKPWRKHAFVNAGLTTAESVAELAELDLDDLFAEPEPPAPPEDDPPENDPEDPEDNDPEDDPKAGPEEPSEGDDPEARARAHAALSVENLELWRRHVRAIAPHESRLTRKITRELMRQRSEILAALEGRGQQGRAILRADEKIDPPALEVAMAAFDSDKFASIFGPIVAEAFKAGALRLLVELEDLGIGDDISVDYKRERIPKLASTYWDSRIKQTVQIGERIKRIVNDSLLDGFSRGENLSDLKDRVRRIFNASASRARTIARTEINTATNGSRFEVAREQGVKRKEWLTSGDEHVRESHDRAGKDGVIDFEERFSNGLAHPHDPSGGAAETVNCRCVLLVRAPSAR